ncbi:MAG: glycerophosphodiester phosphodiesterase family protein [Crocinitomicaceae bacterium]
MSLYEERALFPANSFEAIQYSADVLGAEGVEIDVQLTKDSVLVLFHDPFITTSPGFSGCIGNYKWNVLKDLKHNNSDYHIVKLDTVMQYLKDRKVKVYLDIKPFDFCNGVNKPLEIIANEVDSIMKNYSDFERKLVIAGSLNRKLLQLLNTDYKCFESTTIDEVLRVAEEDGFDYVMVPNKAVDEKSVFRLLHSPFNWGTFGGKSNGEIRKTVSYKPDCFISDNFVFTQKITK